LFKLRKHRYDRLFNLLQQRSCSYHFYSVLSLLVIIHGFADFINTRFIRVLEFSFSSIDLGILVSILNSSFTILKYFILYYGLKIYGFRIQILILEVFKMISIITGIFRIFINIRLLNIYDFNLKFTSVLLESIQYMTSIL